MGPRFVNVEYRPYFAGGPYYERGFNGATFCERGIPSPYPNACFAIIRFNGATFCERGIPLS